MVRFRLGGQHEHEREGGGYRDQVVPERRPEQRHRGRPEAADDGSDGRHDPRAPRIVARQHAQAEGEEQQHVQAVDRAEQKAEHARRQAGDAEVVEDVYERRQEALAASGRQVAKRPAVQERVACVVVVVQQVEVEILAEPQRQAAHQRQDQDGEQGQRPCRTDRAAWGCHALGCGVCHSTLAHMLPFDRPRSRVYGSADDR